MSKNVDAFGLYLQEEERLNLSDWGLSERDFESLRYGAAIVREPLRPVYDEEDDEAVYGYNPYDA